MPEEAVRVEQVESPDSVGGERDAGHSADLGLGQRRCAPRDQASLAQALCELLEPDAPRIATGHWRGFRDCRILLKAHGICRTAGQRPRDHCCAERTEARRCQPHPSCEHAC
jgi:hypothetical protein